MGERKQKDTHLRIIWFSKRDLLGKKEKKSQGNDI